MNNSHTEEPSSEANHAELIQQILANPNSEMAKSLTQSKKLLSQTFYWPCKGGHSSSL